jgi:hypothetical protein
MAISVSEPINQAIDRATRMLFKPFSAGKWFTLGFSAWLAQLGEGGGNNFDVSDFRGGPPTPPGPGGPTSPQSNAELMEEVKQFLLDNAWWMAPLLVLGIAIWVALTWVRARGKFMFLEGVAYDRAAVVEPWKRLATPANAYFRFELLLTVLMIVSLVAVLALSLVIALPDIQAEELTASGITAIVVGSFLLLVWGLGFGVIGAIADDFLIPLMYLRGGTVGTAWGEFRRSLLPGNFGSFTLFYLLRLVLGIGMAVIMVVGTCVTCCVAALPYLGTVFFLPLFVFSRAYTLYFLRQFGPQYDLVAEIPQPPAAAFPVIFTPPPGSPPDGGGQWPNSQA